LVKCKEFRRQTVINVAHPIRFGQWLPLGF